MARPAPSTTGTHPVGRVERHCGLHVAWLSRTALILQGGAYSGGNGAVAANLGGAGGGSASGIELQDDASLIVLAAGGGSSFLVPVAE